ncbi:MAG TPA: ABC transporter ATP-binding protein [Candidatus Dormibacteraeota bacterium]|nr:ABC transporter ATP-binding protein [Candidatus Dormibacteraeota bacterium]
MPGLLLVAGLHLGHGHHPHVRLVLALVGVVAAIVAIIITVALVRRRRGERLPDRPRRSSAGGDDDDAAPAAIRVDHLGKVYRMGRVSVPALDDVSLTVTEGDMVCIMGRSGSGKSTLLRQLGLIDRPTEGEVQIQGMDVTALSERGRARLRLESLGYVFQEYALLPELTARENVYLPAMMLGGSGHDHRRRALELLELVGLGDRVDHRPRELSGGEQQRVAIARALVNEPQIIYADEPTANLDSQSARTVMETLRRLNRELGVTVLFVSHDPEDAQYAKRLVQLKDGHMTGEQS